MLVVNSGIKDGNYDSRTVVAKVPHRLVKDIRVSYLRAPRGLVKQRHYHRLLFDHHHSVKRPDFDQRTHRDVIDNNGVENVEGVEPRTLVLPAVVVQHRLDGADVTLPGVPRVIDDDCYSGPPVLPSD